MMHHFILTFTEDCVCCSDDDDILSHQALIATESDENLAYQVLENVKTIKEDLDAHNSEIKYTDDDEDCLTPEEACKNNIIDEITVGFLNWFIPESNAQGYDWESNGWDEKIEIILDYLSQSMPFKNIDTKNVKIAVN
jgi:hypothetical protein